MESLVKRYQSLLGEFVMRRTGSEEIGQLKKSTVGRPYLPRVFADDYYARWGALIYRFEWKIQVHSVGSLRAEIRRAVSSGDGNYTEEYRDLVRIWWRMVNDEESECVLELSSGGKTRTFVLTEKEARKGGVGRLLRREPSSFNFEEKVIRAIEDAFMYQCKIRTLFFL